MKIFSNIFLFLGIGSIVCCVILYMAGYYEEALILTGNGIVSTLVADLTYRTYRKQKNR